MPNTKYRWWANGEMKPWEKIKHKPMMMLEHATSIRFMESTNHFDSNKEEMYADDIVQAVASKDWPDDSYIGRVIRAEDGQWQIAEAGYEHGLPINWGGFESITILGNVHQNPDLLTKHL